MARKRLTGGVTAFLITGFIGAASLTLSINAASTLSGSSTAPGTPSATVSQEDGTIREDTFTDRNSFLYPDGSTCIKQGTGSFTVRNKVIDNGTPGPHVKLCGGSITWPMLKPEEATATAGAIATATAIAANPQVPEDCFKQSKDALLHLNKVSGKVELTCIVPGTLRTGATPTPAK